MNGKSAGISQNDTNKIIERYRKRKYNQREETPK